MWEVFTAIEEPGARYDVVVRLVEPGELYGVERADVCETRSLAFYHRYRSAEDRLRHHNIREPHGAFIVASHVEKLLHVDPERSWDAIGGIQAAASRSVLRKAVGWLEQELGATVIAMGPRQRLSSLAERAA